MEYLSKNIVKQVAWRIKVDKSLTEIEKMLLKNRNYFYEATPVSEKILSSTDENLIEIIAKTTN